ncbi:hypothetical protein F3Y22_tig00002511pilonHSYRG00175 [Hibiscus syriacus]|uniref:S1 motif domain-containing protein n=1 Tax=Hibiscus syriacus TaxID=106335 RepID=A0A6A3CS28_HIBSY|nr:hypothetical protein F3Y22_tig00002511pilonHSYRG00175 [Hibiscus syriacus]
MASNSAKTRVKRVPGDVPFASSAKGCHFGKYISNGAKKMPEQLENDSGIEGNKEVELLNKPRPTPVNNGFISDIDEESMKPGKDEALEPFLKFFGPGNSLEVEEGDELGVSEEESDEVKKMGIVKDDDAMSGAPVPGRPVVETGTVLFAEGLRAFLPKAELMKRINNFSELKEYVGHGMHVKVARINEANNDLILSERDFVVTADATILICINSFSLIQESRQYLGVFLPLFLPLSSSCTSLSFQSRVILGIMVDLTVDPEDVSPNASSLSLGASRGMLGVQHIPKHDTVKLTESTYLLWKHHIALIIDGYGLLKFIYAGSTIPVEFFTNVAGQLEENLGFAAYRQQDKLLASWILTTVSTEVLPHLTGLTTALSIWNTIARLFGAHSSAKISSLCVVTEQEHVSVVLVGLSMEFESIIVIASREALSLDVLTEMLLDCEARQKVFLSEGISANLDVRSREGSATEVNTHG